MLSCLRFETAKPAGAAAPERTDIAAFIGFVGRRPGAALPAPIARTLTEAGWLNGPWGRAPGAVEALDNVPVVVESWDAFAALFAWERRPFGTGTSGHCTTYLGAAVRSFFAQGGRRAVIVRMGDPYPVTETPGDRTDQRAARLQRLLPGYAEPGVSAVPFDRMDPGTWRGIHHLYGLPEVNHLCLPDLPDLCAAERPLPPPAFTPVRGPEVFVECSDEDPLPRDDSALRRLWAPRCDTEGFAVWRNGIAAALDFLHHFCPDVLLLAGVPRPLETGTTESADAEEPELALLRKMPLGTSAAVQTEGRDRHARLQLVWPWLATRRSRDLPEQIEPPDGVFAGLLAANALTRGTFRSVGGQPLTDTFALQPEPSTGLGPDSPSERLAERVCLFVREADGIQLRSDVTASGEMDWRAGGTCRLMNAVARAAQRFGEAHLFETNGPALWTHLKRSLDGLLLAFWDEGALNGATPAEAFTVRCDRSTMSQNDLDNGRLKAEISLHPAAAIGTITVVLDLAATGPSADRIPEVA